MINESKGESKNIKNSTEEVTEAGARVHVIQLKAGDPCVSVSL